MMLSCVIYSKTQCKSSKDLNLKKQGWDNLKPGINIEVSVSSQKTTRCNNPESPTVLLITCQLTGLMLAMSRLERGTALFSTWNVR